MYQELWINCNFNRPCKIYIICKVEWQNIAVNEFIFNTYGPEFCQKRVMEMIMSNEDLNNIGQIHFIQRDSELEQQNKEQQIQSKNLNVGQEDQEQIIQTLTQQKEHKSYGYCSIY
ncbi:unnamed protein product [Paramecium sonneborni]|uniref:Uncharacterized protein n=1 Tax=Paramecium sonneborni TaxID=65129 RepID=A0A8S1NKE4_9CILI|nr:unnamed protein product [Paramecium sonneborni]